MKVWTCDSFEGYWPVGTAAVIWADDADAAARILNRELVAKGLPGGVNAAEMLEFPAAVLVRVLCDGNY